MENKRAYIAIGVVLLLACVASAYQFKRMQTAASEHKVNQISSTRASASNNSAELVAHADQATTGKIRILRASDLEDEAQANAEATNAQALLGKLASAGIIVNAPAASEASATNPNKNTEPEHAAKQAAARAFLLYYLANSRERVRLCQQHGVAIDSFLSAFEDLHQREMKQSMALFPDIEGELAHVHSQNRVQISQSVAVELNVIAQATHASLKDACIFFDKNSASYVESLQFSRINPKQHQILVGN